MNLSHLLDDPEVAAEFAAGLLVPPTLPRRPRRSKSWSMLMMKRRKGVSVNLRNGVFAPVKFRAGMRHSRGMRIV